MKRTVVVYAVSFVIWLGLMIAAMSLMGCQSRCPDCAAPECLVRPVHGEMKELR